jgi:hypothetical protein
MTPQDQLGSDLISLDEYEERWAKKLGVPIEIVRAVRGGESSNSQTDPKTGKTLTSHKGARGRFQLDPDTAKGLGVNPDDEFENTYGGIAYLAQGYREASKLRDLPEDARWGAALVHYHGGPGGLRQAYQTGTYRSDATDTHKGIDSYTYARKILNDAHRMRGEQPQAEEAARPADAAPAPTEPAAPALAEGLQSLARRPGVSGLPVQSRSAQQFKQPATYVPQQGKPKPSWWAPEGEEQEFAGRPKPQVQRQQVAQAPPVRDETRPTVQSDPVGAIGFLMKNLLARSAGLPVSPPPARQQAQVQQPIQPTMQAAPPVVRSKWAGAAKPEASLYASAKVGEIPEAKPSATTPEPQETGSFLDNLKTGWLQSDARVTGAQIRLLDQSPQRLLDPEGYRRSRETLLKEKERLEAQAAVKEAAEPLSLAGILRGVGQVAGDMRSIGTAAATGGIAGGGIGSIVPGVGTAIGATAGGLAGATYGAAMLEDKPLDQFLAGASVPLGAAAGGAAARAMAPAVKGIASPIIRRGAQTLGGMAAGGLEEGVPAALFNLKDPGTWGQYAQGVASETLLGGLLGGSGGLHASRAKPRGLERVAPITQQPSAQPGIIPGDPAYAQPTLKDLKGKVATPAPTTPIAPVEDEPDFAGTSGQPPVVSEPEMGIPAEDEPDFIPTPTEQPEQAEQQSQAPATPPPAQKVITDQTPRKKRDKGHIEARLGVDLTYYAGEGNNSVFLDPDVRTAINMGLADMQARGITPTRKSGESLLNIDDLTDRVAWEEGQTGAYTPEQQAARQKGGDEIGSAHAGLRAIMKDRLSGYMGGKEMDSLKWATPNDFIDWFNENIPPTSDAWRKLRNVFNAERIPWPAHAAAEGGRRQGLEGLVGLPKELDVMDEVVGSLSGTPPQSTVAAKIANVVGTDEEIANQFAYTYSGLIAHELAPVGQNRHYRGQKIDFSNMNREAFVDRALDVVIEHQIELETAKQAEEAAKANQGTKAAKTARARVLQFKTAQLPEGVGRSRHELELAKNQLETEIEAAFAEGTDAGEVRAERLQRDLQQVNGTLRQMIVQQPQAPKVQSAAAAKARQRQGRAAATGVAPAADTVVAPDTVAENVPEVDPDAELLAELDSFTARIADVKKAIQDITPEMEQEYDTEEEAYAKYVEETKAEQKARGVKQEDQLESYVGPQGDERKLEMLLRRGYFDTPTGEIDTARFREAMNAIKDTTSDPDIKLSPEEEAELAQPYQSYEIRDPDADKANIAAYTGQKGAKRGPKAKGKSKAAQMAEQRVAGPALTPEQQDDVRILASLRHEARRRYEAEAITVNPNQDTLRSLGSQIDELTRDIENVGVEEQKAKTAEQEAKIRDLTKEQRGLERFVSKLGGILSAVDKAMDRATEASNAGDMDAADRWVQLQKYRMSSGQRLQQAVARVREIETTIDNIYQGHEAAEEAKPQKRRRGRPRKDAGLEEAGLSGSGEIERPEIDETAGLGRALTTEGISGMGSIEGARRAQRESRRSLEEMEGEGTRRSQYETDEEEPAYIRKELKEELEARDRGEKLKPTKEDLAEAAREIKRRTKGMPLRATHRIKPAQLWKAIYESARNLIAPSLAVQLQESPLATIGGSVVLIGNAKLAKQVYPGDIWSPLTPDVGRVPAEKEAEIGLRLRAAWNRWDAAKLDVNYHNRHIEAANKRLAELDWKPDALSGKSAPVEVRALSMRLDALTTGLWQAEQEKAKAGEEHSKIERELSALERSPAAKLEVMRHGYSGSGRAGRGRKWRAAQAGLDTHEPAILASQVTPRLKDPDAVRAQFAKQQPNREQAIINQNDAWQELYNRLPNWMPVADRAQLTNTLGRAAVLGLNRSRLRGLLDKAIGQIPQGRSAHPVPKVGLRKAALQYAETIEQFPQEYFEAKPRRLVDLSEFEAVVIPDTEEALIRALRDMGLYVRTYPVHHGRQTLSQVVQDLVTEADLAYIRKEDQKAASTKPVEQLFPRTKWKKDVSSGGNDAMETIRRAAFAPVKALADLGDVQAVEGNEAMSQLMDAAFDDLGYTGRGWDAVALPRKFLGKLTAALREYGPKAEGLAKYFESIQDQPTYGDRVLYFNTGVRISDARLYDTVIHEIGHAFNVDVSKQLAPWEGKFVAGDAAYAGLKKGIGELEGNPDISDAIVEKEAPSYVLSGSWKQLGFKNSSQARTFLKRYVRALAHDFGAAGLERWPLAKGSATDTMTTVIKEIQSEIQRAEARKSKAGVKGKAKAGAATGRVTGTATTGAGGAGILPRGGAGVPGGGGAGIGPAGRPVVPAGAPGGAGAAGAGGRLVIPPPPGTALGAARANRWQRGMQQAGTMMAGANLLHPAFFWTNVLGGLGGAVQRRFEDRVAAGFDAVRARAEGTPNKRTIVAPTRKLRRELKYTWSQALAERRKIREGAKLSGQIRKAEKAGDAALVANLTAQLNLHQPTIMGMGGTPIPAHTKFPSSGPWGRFGRHVERMLGYTNSVSDTAYFQAAYQDAVKSQLTAYAKDPTAPDLTAEQVLQIHDTAEIQANEQVFNATTGFTKVAEGLKHYGNLITGDPAYGLASAAGFHYPRVPTNIAHQGILRASPAPAIFAIAKQMAKGKGNLDKRGTARLFAKGVTGTGYLGGGALMAAMGVLVVPDDDKDKFGIHAEEGLGRYQVNMSAIDRLARGGIWDIANGWPEGKKRKGDKMASYEWVQPGSIGASIGAAIYDIGKKKGKTLKQTIYSVAGAFDGMMNVMSDQTVIGSARKLGRVGLAMAEGDFDAAGRHLRAIAASVPTAFVPRMLQLAKFVEDPIRRDTRPKEPAGAAGLGREMANRVQAAVPFASEELPAKPGAFGEREVKMTESGLLSRFGQALIPPKISTYKGTPAAEALDEVDMSPAAPRRVKGEPTSNLREREVSVGKEFKRLMDQNLGRLSRLPVEERKKEIIELRKKAAKAAPHTPAHIRNARIRAGLPPVAPE